MRPAGSCRFDQALDSDLQLGDRASARRDGALGPDPAGSQDPKRPVAWRGVEGETAVLAERYLGDELAVGIQQPGVSGRHRRPRARHVPLDHVLVTGSGGYLHAAGPSATTPPPAAHFPAPSSLGTPTREPYSVHQTS